MVSGKYLSATLYVHCLSGFVLPAVVSLHCRYPFGSHARMLISCLLAIMLTHQVTHWYWLHNTFSNHYSVHWTAPKCRPHGASAQQLANSTDSRARFCDFRASRLAQEHRSFRDRFATPSVLSFLNATWKLFSSQRYPIYETKLLFWKVTRLRPFVLLVRATCRSRASKHVTTNSRAWKNTVSGVPDRLNYSVFFLFYVHNLQIWPRAA